MRKFFSSLMFKISFTILVIETLALTLLGTYYVNRFANEIDAREEAKACVPGILMGQKALNYDAVRDRKAMDRLVGGRVLEATVIRRDGIVFYDPHSEHESIPVTDVLDSYYTRHLRLDLAETHIQRPSGREHPHMAVTTPLFSEERLIGHLFLLVDTSRAEKEKDGIARLFAIGSLLCILLTTLSEVLIVHLLTGPRIHETVVCLQAVAGGDLGARIAHATSEDELGVLERNVNEMAKQIEERTILRAAAERDLAESELRYRTLVENIDLGITLVSKDFRVLMSNARQGRFFKKSPAEFIAKYCYEEFERRKAACENCPGSVAMRTGQPAELEKESVMEDGTRIALRIHAFPAYDARGEVMGFIEVVEDITDKKKAQDQLRTLGAAMEQSMDGIAIANLQGTITYVNSAWTKMHGYESCDELIGKKLEMFHTERQLQEDVIPFNMLVKEYGSHEGDVGHVRKDGTAFPTWMASILLKDEKEKPIAFVGVARDITERQEAEAQRLSLEKQVQQAQKLEGLGLLAGGIAHDFNNLLLGILGNADMALDDLPAGSTVRDAMENVRTASRRAAELCQQMLAYAGERPAVMTPLDLNSIVLEMGDLLKTTVPKKVVLEYGLDSKIPAISGDAAQVRQVVMNLITNAGDAIGEQSGRVLLKTGLMDVDRDYLKKSYFGENIKDGRCVYVSVQDTGCGMDPETRERLFDPFFTTKSYGRGLGLSAVLGIVRGHNGAVHVDSTPGEGTTFSVLFPPSAAVVEIKTEEHKDAADWEGEGKILVVDDEPIVLTVAERMLEMQGFSVLQAVDGGEAVEVFRENAADIRAVLLDLTMPVMDGMEVLGKLYEIRKDIPVLLASGYTSYEISKPFAESGLVEFLHKPYDRRQMITMLRELLEKADQAKG